MLSVPQISIYSVCAAAFLASCGPAASTTPEARAPLAQAPPDTCDGPDADIRCCFVNTPKAVGNVMAIRQVTAEPGEKLVISGTVFRADGRTPYPNVLLYAYHTDSRGYYAKSGQETGIQKWHGRLHGWVKTDQQGRYKIRTIRPAPYPSRTMPAHIHAAIQEPGGKPPYYISDFVFKDDALVNDKYLQSIEAMVGGTGIVESTKSTAGTWTGQRNITVGL